jgi:hypothetical protein
VFVSDRPFLLSKARAYPFKAYYRVGSKALSTNIRFDWKGLVVKNHLAYWAHLLAKKKIVF